MSTEDLVVDALIIDDNEIDRYLAQRALKQFEHIGEIREFADGEDAAKAFENEELTGRMLATPTLVLLDINMPRMSGFEFLSHTADHLNGLIHASVILMLTSSIRSSDRERAATFEVIKGHMEKPIDQSKLGQVLHEHFAFRASE